MKIFQRLTMLLLVLALASCQMKDEQAKQTATKYTCSMHPQVIQDHPGTCPICGMALVPVRSSNDQDGAIMLSESQIMLGNISTVAARSRDFITSGAINGKLVVDEEQTEVISSRASGRIENLYVKELGKEVKKGQPLYEIYSEQLLTLQQEYLLALKQYDVLKESRYESFLKAAEKKLLLYGMASGQINQLAKRQTTQAKIDFLSPASGVVTEINANEGQYVEEGMLLYRIEKLDELWVDAELYANEESGLSVGDNLKVIVNGFENDVLHSKIIFLGPEYRQGSQIMTLRASISNKQHRLLPGMQARVLLTDSEKNVIILPIDAVIRSAEGDHVWIRNEDGSFKPRMVETGTETQDEIEITEGIAEDENVVTTGAYLLYGELVLKKGGDPMTGHQH